MGDLLKIIRYALYIWSVNCYYNLVCRREADIERMEGERNTLRTAGDPDSQLAADRVQQQIVRRAGIYVPEPPADPQPAAGAPPPGGAAGGHS